jgi:single-strand DNA-binding protein
MSYAKVTVIGNLTRDPEPGQLPNSDTVTSRFTVATNAKVKGEDVATFFRVSLIGRQADLANQYLTKGRQVYIEGTLHMERYDSKEGAQQGVSLEVRGTEMQFVGGRPEGDAAPKANVAAAGSSRPATKPTVNDDIPF